tara:strand:+ start:465 stop:620 length:156 start_codon:yes stop_codon:yes gene_type:complete
MLKKEAIKIVLAELLNRLPENNLDGFLPNDEVYEAIALLSTEDKDAKSLHE